MELEIIAIYCWCELILNQLNIKDDCRTVYTEEKYRGYQASKKRYFYGIKVHMVVTTDGKPIEFILSPGSCSDISCDCKRV